MPEVVDELHIVAFDGDDGEPGSANVGEGGGKGGERRANALDCLDFAEDWEVAGYGGVVGMVIGIGMVRGGEVGGT